MPRPGSKIEKSKDFKGSMIKILKSLKPWHFIITVSLILAMTSAIISLIAPNKLSDLTNYITEGIKPNMNENTINDIMSSDKIKPQDKATFMEFLNKVKQEENSDKVFKLIDELPESVYEVVKPNMNTTKIEKLAVLLATLYIISSIFGYIQQLLMATVTNNYSKKLRSNINNKIEKLPLKYFDNH